MEMLKFSGGEAR